MPTRQNDRPTYQNITASQNKWGKYGNLIINIL